MPKTIAKDPDALAERLAAALEARRPRMSRSQLAAKLGVSAGAVSHWLNGNRPCPNDVVLKIAKLTKAEPGWLLHGAKGPADATRATTNGRPSVKTLVWGFGTPLAVAFLVPFVAVFLMPGAVAGATLMARDLLGEETEGDDSAAEPEEEGVDA